MVIVERQLARLQLVCRLSSQILLFFIQLSQQSGYGKVDFLPLLKPWRKSIEGYLGLSLIMSCCSVCQWALRLVFI